MNDNVDKFILQQTTVPANKIEPPRKVLKFKILVFPSQRLPKFLMVPIVLYHKRSQKNFIPLDHIGKYVKPIMFSVLKLL